MNKLVYIIVLITVFGGATLAQEAEPDTVTSAPGITIETSVDRAEIYIGDLITYRLSIIHDSAIVLTPPPIGANLGAFDVKDYQSDVEERLDDGRIKMGSGFLLTTFTTGDYVIPPIPVEFMLPDSTKRILISEPVPIKVKSLLAESADTADIRDIKGPIQFQSKIPWYYYAIGGAILTIIAALVYWWWRKRHQGDTEEPIDTRDPWEIALEGMAFLKEKNYLAKGEFKLYYIELSEILRGYLGRIYSIPVLDMTTFEFLKAIEELEIEEELYNRYKLFLEFSDLVKFAKFVPELEKTEIDYEEVISMIDYVRQLELSKLQPSITQETTDEAVREEAKNV